MKIPEEIREALDQTGLPWGVETGSKHYKVKLAGRLAGVLPFGKPQERDRRSVFNTIAQIRRLARELHPL